jgi:5-methylcytosine-specific restriction endonuclease McrA
MTQQQFYHSKAWRRLSRAFLLSQNYICERCGKPADIAHHRRHITPQNVNDPDIALNPASLEALCIDCHNAEHFGTGGAVVRGLSFTNNGDLRKEITL